MKCLFKIFPAFFTIVVLSGCQAESFPSCQSEVVSSANGKCSAYYYQTDFRSEGATTQALVSCNFITGKVGGNIVAFHNLKTGIGLSWVDDHTLEVAVPNNVKLEDQRVSDTYLGYKLHYRYRQLQANEPAALGCGVSGI